MDELWKDIPYYTSWYQVSSLGRIRSLMRKNRWGYIQKIRILRPFPNQKGYLRIDLRKNGQRDCRQVHRLVLETFVGLCPDGMECRHLDGNPQNNKLDNLQWTTASENQRDRVRHGTSNMGLTYNRGESQGGHKLTEEQVLEIRELYKISLSSGKRIYSQRKLASIFGVQQTAIKDVVNRKTWKHI